MPGSDWRTVRALLGVVAVVGLVSHANAQTMVEYSAETRFQLDLHVQDAGLTALLPAGWTLNVATQGPAKDANLRAVFIDRLTINGPDGKPVGKGSNRLVYLAAPVKDPAGANAQFVVSAWRCTSSTNAVSETKAIPPRPASIRRRIRASIRSPDVTPNPADRVKEFSFKASGGTYARLFDGSEKVLSWDNIVWINRSVLLP